MDEILNHQQKQEQPEFNFATVGGVYPDGLSLIFDGQEGESEKHYKCNTSITFRAGDRVRIFRDSGTYVVEYVIGDPVDNTVHGIPSGGAAGKILSKLSAGDYDVGWTDAPDMSNGLPAGGSDGQSLIKSGSANYAAAWGNPVVGSIANQYGPTIRSYDIQLRTTNAAGAAFQIRMGSGSWKNITVT